jgi:uncharacterized protein YjbI with pentapeptide repeats
MYWNRQQRATPQPSTEERQREQVAKVAHELYRNRLLLGRLGDSQSDWIAAEAIVGNPMRTTLFVSNRPLIKLRKPAGQTIRDVVWELPKWMLLSLPKLEWVKLLAVPLALGFMGSVITSQIQREANQNAILKAYFDQLETLIFEHSLLSEIPAPGAVVLARGRTVAALGELDLKRRSQLVAFLQASALCRFGEDGKEPIISFSNQNLAGLNLNSITLDNTDFSYATLRTAKLAGTSLVGANLAEADLRETDLPRANLQDANLARGRLDRANLQGAELLGSNLSGASLTRGNLRRASLRGANLAGASLEQANLSRASLDIASLAGANLTRTNLAAANLLGTNLQDTNLGRANLQGAKLRVANLQRSNLTAANLRRADLVGANLRGATLADANLQGARLIGTNLTDIPDLTQAQLAHARLCGVKLPNGLALDPNRDCSGLGVDSPQQQ